MLSQAEEVQISDARLYDLERPDCSRLVPEDQQNALAINAKVVLDATCLSPVSQSILLSHTGRVSVFRSCGSVRRSAAFSF